METDLLRVAATARLAGMTPRTLRYYEQIGLVTPAARSAAGQRLYSGGDVSRLQRIDHLRASVGPSLAEVRELLDAEAVREDLRDGYRRAADDATRRRTVEAATAVLERQLAVIRRKRQVLEELEAEYAAKLERMRRLREEADRAAPRVASLPAAAAPSEATMRR